jgi:hypothetical protein
MAMGMEAFNLSIHEYLRKFEQESQPAQRVKRQ